MKKLLAVIAVSAMALGAYHLYALNNIIYRIRFHVTSACDQNAWYEPSTGGQFGIPPEGQEIYSGDKFEVVTLPGCCSTSSQQVASVTVEQSSNGGQSWTPKGNPLPIMMPPYQSDDVWTFVVDYVNGTVATSYPVNKQTCAPQPQ
jgi:hypothetical protein